MVAGVEPVEMNILSELWLGMPLGSHTSTWGWPEDAIAAAASRLAAANLVDDAGLTAAGRQLREELEDRTDAQQQSVVDALGEDFEPVVAALNRASAACIAAGAFPPDPYKRAGG